MYFQLEENCLTMLDSGFLTCFRFVLFLFFQWSCVSLVIITSSSEWGYCWLPTCQVWFPCKMDSPSRTAGEGNGTPLQYSCLENPMDGGAWCATVHGSLGVGYDWATSLSRFTFVHWRRKWQPTPVFLPGESQGRGSLVGGHLWGLTESDTTEAT